MTCVEWTHPSTVAQAIDALADGHGQAVAGGTTVLDLLKLGHETPKRFVDLGRLPLREITVTQSSVSIGALASNSQVANSELVRTEFAAISESILAGASQQIRNAATVAGNIMQATRCPYFRTVDWACNKRQPGSGCEALRAAGPGHAILGTSNNCIAVHPSDFAVALLAFDAIVHTQTPAGRTSLPIAEFYLLPGETPERENRLPPASLIVAVEIPRKMEARRSAYLKLRGRASYEFAAASVAAVLTFKEGRVATVSVALGGVATAPWRKPANRWIELVLSASATNSLQLQARCRRPPTSCRWCAALFIMCSRGSQNNENYWRTL